MYPKRMLSLLLSLCLSVINLRADEGMWLLNLVGEQKYEQMKAMGLKLTPEQIYNINKSSLKDAILQFGRGCTGSLISAQGLVLTNHHCGYSQIQSHSTVENDYLQHGFWARSFEEEIPNEGLTARFLVRIEDVSEKILTALDDTMSETKRNQAIRRVSRSIEDEATEGTHYEARVASFYAGNEFYLMVYEIFEDIRFVGAPPSSIGKFGGDTDNWMWPRHTGDFALFRVYMSPDGKPAPFAEENIPYRPKHYLPVSTAGVEKGDFSMTLGFGGRTDRYLTSFGIRQAKEQVNPSIVKIREKKLAIMREDMDKDDKVRIQYATKYAQTSNFWKYFIGQTRGLKQLNVYERKKELEEEFVNWAHSSPQNTQKYADVIPNIEKSYKMSSVYNKTRWYFMEAIIRGGELTLFARRFEPLYHELNQRNPDEERIAAMTYALKQQLDDFYRDFNKETDKKIFAALLEMYFNDVPSELQPPILERINKRFRGDFNSYADRVYSKTIFASREDVEKFLERPRSRVLRRDPVFELMQALFTSYFDIMEKMRPGNELFNRYNRLFIAGLREMKTDKIFYPDANSTFRLSYGQVLDYYPTDAVHYHYHTTTDGILQKEVPNDREFHVPEKLKTLIENKDFGGYDKDGVMYVNFISNNDVTGGNSGSPVINGKGALIGLVFDGNWEAMSGDIFFEAEIQRCISVDARYILFVIEKYAKAHHILKELTLVP